jgi:uncharacterized membrane protein
LGGGKKRVWEIDFLRGILMCAMLFDHLMFDLGYLVPEALNFGDFENRFFDAAADFAQTYWYGLFRTVVRSIIVFLFLFLSGISCTLTRSNAGRLRKTAIAAAIVTIVTYSVDLVAAFGLSIAFGILHIMCFSLLLYMVMKALFPHRGFYLIVGALLVVGGLFLVTEKGTVPFWEWEKLDYSGKYDRAMGMYRLNWEGFVEVFLGTGAFGSDSYGIFPYTGFFLLGAAAGEVLYKSKKSLLPVLDGRWNKVYSFIGRHGLWFYLIHQVAVLLLVVCAAMAAGYRFF